MNLDGSLSTTFRNCLLSFVINAFQSLDNGLVRKECAPLVSISVWNNLAGESSRDRRIEKNPQLRKAWRASQKRYDAADEPNKARLRFERSWLYSMVLGFYNHIYPSKAQDAESVLYCEKFLELLVDLESQLPTRRYVNTLLKDLNILPVIRLSPLYNKVENALFRDFFNLLRHFIHFSIDDHSGEQHSPQGTYDFHSRALARLQRAAFKHFPEKLKILALSNYGSIDQRQELEGHLASLETSEIETLCALLDFRTSYPKSSNVVADRQLFMETLLSAFERRKSFQESAALLEILPTEKNLYDPALLRNELYDGSRPLAIPKLNLQYLTVGDFLWRSFILHRSEAFFEIRKDMEDVIKRLQPRIGREGKTVFEGFSRMAIPIPKPAVVEMAPAKVGMETPAFVRAEIALDVSRLNDNIRKEWESLRSDDVVFLLSVQGKDDRMITNGFSGGPAESGLQYIRAAEVVQVLDENGRTLRDTRMDQMDGFSRRPRSRRLLVNIDAAAFKADKERVNNGKPDIYESINVIARRRGRENNFKPVLESMRSLTIAEVPIPSWLSEVFLGYGDPTGATYKSLPNRLKSVDFRDTFLQWQHLVESFPGKSVEPDEDADSAFGPPYVLEFPSDEAPMPAPNPSKKRRRDQTEAPQAPRKAHESVKVSTYKPSNTGPYPMDAPRLNQVRFTPAQIEAIISGTQPGLTVVVGPPGTGKTDVATQIINNLYHNFRDERILLVAHSNQALNQLFQKITALDIDERHLLRLGHGEEDLETEANFSKHGRVESFLDNRQRYLVEVDRLAAALGAVGAHGSSCETAGYFHSVYIAPAWTSYWETVNSPEADSNTIISAFPFQSYFVDAPQPIFPPSASKEALLDIAAGCQYHIEKIFTELEDIRPFEILRSPRDRANYLLIKEARIIAMTSTHAAMRREEIANLGFHYDSIIMEEAAQITEIENFIPCALQLPKNGEMPLKRVVLVGDHLQNSPIVQNLAFRQYANLEQSLFLRLVRLGVPTINLDQQGRARSSIAELFKWRYPRLDNLPIVNALPEFKSANAGFRYDYQFIDVPDYKGRGEMEPTPHFIQNLGEAEYAVALFQYMRLLGYPAASISILTTYAGQKALIRDVLNHRCARNRLFGMPRLVTTVDKYQGEQNDCTLYFILSSPSFHLP